MNDSDALYRTAVQFGLHRRLTRDELRYTLGVPDDLIEDDAMSDKAWAKPGLTPEERANALVAAVAMPLVPEIVEALRADRADAIEEAAAALECRACAVGWSTPAAVGYRMAALHVRRLAGGLGPKANAPAA